MKRKTLLYRAFILAGLLSVFLLPGIIGVHADVITLDYKQYWDQNNNEQSLVYGVTNCTVKGFRLHGWVASNEQPNCIRMDIFSWGAEGQGINQGYWAIQSDSTWWDSEPGDKEAILVAAGGGYSQAYRFYITFNLDNWYDNPNFRLNQYFTIRIRYFAKDNKEIHDIMWTTPEGTERENLDIQFVRFDAHTVTGAPYTETYTGAAISYPDSSVSAESNGAKSYTYFDAEKNELACMPVSAGTYYVKVRMAETNKYTEKTSDYIPITVTKATRTISLSKGADSGAPHALTYPFADTFVVRANGMEEPGVVTAADTAYATFQTDTQTVTYMEDFDDIDAGSLPSGYRVIVEESPPTTAGVSSGGVELRSMENDVARHLVRLPVENLLASDFVFEADVTFLEVIDDRRWVSLAYSLQDERYLTYMQMAVRQGTTADDGVEYAHWTGADYWTVRETAAYSSALAIGTTHHLKVEGSKGYIREYVDGDLVLELTDIYYEAGGFGLSVAGCHARFDNISISGSAAERVTVTTTPIKATDGVQSTTVTMAETQNYHAATATYYYQIDKGTIHYTAEDYEGVYDQVGHGITLNIASPENTMVCYGTAADACLSVENPTYSDVGDYTVHFTIEKENYHAVADSRKVTITPVYLAMTFDAADKAYDTKAEATGTFTLSGVLAGDSVAAQAASTTFASALPGTHTVTASGITLNNKNYALDATEMTDTATISPIENLVITHISDAINAVTEVDMTALVHNTLTAHVPLFPTVAASSSTAYNDGTFGSVTNARYNRHTAYVDVLGVLNDSMPFIVSISGVPVASGTLYVTTGHDMVYGTNEVKPQNASHQPVEILKFANTWEENQEAHTASIATGDATTVTFKAYLRAGEKLQVATAIGIYHGRTIVTVRENGLLLATDKIDAFFPVPYEESYIISDMTTTHYIGTKNPNRGDYLNQVPEFVAPHAGVYDITINVTGESYLLDAQLGLGAMYQGNSPASKPITTLKSIKIL